MGTNFVAPLEGAPQLSAGVCLDTAAREVLRCPACQLVQYRTANHHCRRCKIDLEARPAPAPSARPAAAAKADEPEPGIETAEASGTLVPDVAGAIRRFRQLRGLSQKQLADRMHVPRTYVSKIENDKATPTVTSLERVAHAMETNVAALLADGDRGGDLYQDAFVQALVPILDKLGPRHRAELLAASRRLATA